MSNSVEFELVSPQRLVKAQSVEMVVVPGAEGDLGILPGHSPLIAEVRPGVISVYENGEITDQVFVAGGFCEVLPERCTVLAEEAIPVNELDKTLASERLKLAVEAEDEIEQRIANAMAAAAAS